MSSNITIYPPLKKSITLNSITVDVFELKLFEYVKVACILYDLNNNPIDSRVYTLTGEDYLNWSNDDSYIINYCKKRLQMETGN
jgi:hypothetical protein